jgi:hypothetical protein
MIEERVNIDQRLSALEAKFDVTFLPACVTTLGRIHGEFLRLLYFISNKQALDYFRPLAMTRTKKNFVIVVASSSTTTAAPLEWHVPRPLRCVAPPRQRVASLPHLATNSPSALIPTSLTGTSATLVTSPLRRIGSLSPHRLVFIIII